MTTDYEFLVPTSCICMYKNIRVWRLWAPGGRGPVCLAHSAHPIATPLALGPPWLRACYTSWAITPTHLNQDSWRRHCLCRCYVWSFMRPRVYLLGCLLGLYLCQCVSRAMAMQLAQVYASQPACVLQYLHASDKQ